MQNSHFDVIVVGAGHAGLGISYHLKKHGLSHVVFERGKVGESWRNQRWDSFAINTPSWSNMLPGESSNDGDPDGFYHRDEFVSCLENYASKHGLPVLENTRVISLESSDNNSKFCVKVSSNGDTNEYFCNHVVVASGIMNEKIIPSASENLSPEIFQLHASEYRNPSQLPEGAVLVVGSAQSGVQITEDLIGAGRRVFLSTGKVPRAPRRYRGKDMVYWFIKTGFWDVTPKDITDPMIFQTRNPQISGVGFRGHTVSLQWLHKKGVEILGRFDNANGNTVYLQPNAADHVKLADEFSNKFKALVDEAIVKNSIDAPPPEYDEADEPDPTASCVSNVTELNLKENNITTVIWTTGFGFDFSWIKLPVLDEKGNPKYVDGISDVDGIYFLGFPWLRKRQSGTIHGVLEDAEFIAGKIIGK